MTFAFTPSTLFIGLQCCLTYKFTALGCLFKYMTYHIFIFFVFPKPSFVQLPLELAAGGSGAMLAGQGRDLCHRPGQGAGQPWAWALLGWPWAEAGRMWGRQGTASAEPMARQGRTVGDGDWPGCRFLGLTRALGSGRMGGPAAGKAGPSESWWCPQSLTSSLCWWPVSLLLSRHPRSVSCPDSPCPKASACSQPVFLCTPINTSSHTGWLLGTTACIKLCLYNTVPVQHCACTTLCLCCES